MKRVVKILKELWGYPGGMLLGIPCALAVVLAIAGAVGRLTLDLFVY